MVYLFVFSVITHREDPALVFVGLGIIRGMQRVLLSSSSPVSLKNQGGFTIERMRTRVTVISSVMIVATDSFFMGIGISGVLIFLGGGILKSLFFVLILFLSNLWWHSLGVCLLKLTSTIPDLHKLLVYFGMAMFFVSPVLYSFEVTSGLHRQLCLYNPISYFIEFSRYMAGTENAMGILPMGGFVTVASLGVLMFVIGSSKIDGIRWDSSNRS